MSNETGEPKEPAPRASVVDMLAAPVSFPDDSAFAAKLRRVDHYVGVVEQVALFVILGAIVVTGTAQAIATKLFQHSLLWSFDIVRAGTFAIAMGGAAFASHQASHLSMDIVSRFISRRTRLIMKILLALFTMFAAYLLLKSGLRLYERVAAEGGHRGVIAIETIAMMIPLGSGLIIFHTLLHFIIDVDYLRRGKLPAEKAMTGH